MTRIREIVFVRPENIIWGNDIPNKGVVAQIKKSFDLDKYAFPTGYDTGKGVILSDGNHRARALVEMGYEYIPIAPLTKKEFDHVKFSKRTVDIKVRIPEMAKIIGRY